MKNVALITVTLALSLCGAGQAMAGTLLDLVNPAIQSNTPYVLLFTAGAATTDIQFEGYQLPAYETVTDISLTTSGGGGNLLGQTWIFTPAPAGTDTSQYDDGYGTGTNGLKFGGVVAGSFDQYDQVVGTVVGQTYNLNFLFTEAYTGPSELVVSASNAGATPEPATLFLFGSGLLGVAIAARKRRKTV